MPDKKPVTNKELMKGFIPALGINLALTVLLGSACGAFETGSSSRLMRELSLIAIVPIQGLTLLVGLAGSFVGKDRGVSRGWTMGAALAIFLTISIWSML